MGFDLYRSHKLPSILNSQVVDTFSKSEIIPILDFQVVTTAFIEPCKRKAMPWEPDNVSLSHDNSSSRSGTDDGNRAMEGGVVGIERLELGREVVMIWESD